jgi:hypothetical protein
MEGIEVSQTIVARQNWRRFKSFTNKPKGSNSTKTLLSTINYQTEIRFLIKDGATRTLRNRNLALEL